ncbi:hypothetical protein BC938DRAFT_474430, partial [Jimgerdemannia flammicorona]
MLASPCSIRTNTDTTAVRTSPGSCSAGGGRSRSCQS